MESNVLAADAAAEIAKVFLRHENLARMIVTGRDPGLPSSGAECWARSIAPYCSAWTMEKAPAAPPEK